MSIWRFVGRIMLLSSFVSALWGSSFYCRMSPAVPTYDQELQELQEHPPSSPNFSFPTMATTPANLPLEEIHDFLVALARKAGHVISSADPSTAESGTKMNSADLVTETDRHVETLVRRELRDRWGDGFA